MFLRQRFFALTIIVFKLRVYKFAWIRKKEVAQRRCGLWVDQSQERRHGGRDARDFTLNWPSFDTSLWVEKASLLFGLV